MEREICEAISRRRLISFIYKGRQRLVEPHMVGYNKSNELALSAWFLSGESASKDGPGWRTYLVNDISGLSVLEQTFDEPRPGYQRDGGKTFRSVRCAI
jgi:hypothetical protein